LWGYREMFEIKNSDVISEEEKSSLLDTAYLLSIKGMKERLDEGLEAIIEDCADFEW